MSENYNDFSLKTYRGNYSINEGFHPVCYLRRLIRQIRWCLIKKGLYPKKLMLASYMRTLQKIHKNLSPSSQGGSSYYKKRALVKNNHKILKEVKGLNTSFLEREKKLVAQILRPEKFSPASSSFSEHESLDHVDCENKWGGYSKEERDLFKKTLATFKNKKGIYATKLSRQKTPLEDSVFLTRKGDLYPVLHKRTKKGLPTFPHVSPVIDSGSFKVCKRLQSPWAVLSPIKTKDLAATRRQFKNGANLFQRLEDKRGVIPYHFASWGGKFCLLSPLCKGTLNHLSLPFLIKLKVFTQIAIALQSFQKITCFHGDIKPGNILVEIDEKGLDLLNASPPDSKEALELVNQNQTKAFLCDYESAVYVDAPISRDALPHFTRKYQALMFYNLKKTFFLKQELFHADQISLGKTMISELKLGKLKQPSYASFEQGLTDENLIEFTDSFDPSSPHSLVALNLIQDKGSSPLIALAGFFDLPATK